MEATPSEPRSRDGPLVRTRCQCARMGGEVQCCHRGQGYLPARTTDIDRSLWSRWSTWRRLLSGSSLSKLSFFVTRVLTSSFQVMYYQDCKLRSLHNRPTEYLAYIDRDEHFFPAYLLTPVPLWTPLSHNLSRLPLSSFLPSYLSTMASDTGSVCFGREMKSGPPIPLDDLVEADVAETEPLELSWLSTLRYPAEFGKCIHHVNRCEVGIVQ